MCCHDHSTLTPFLPTPQFFETMSYTSWLKSAPSDLRDGVLWSHCLATMTNELAEFHSNWNLTLGHGIPAEFFASAFIRFIENQEECISKLTKLFGSTTLVHDSLILCNESHAFEIAHKIWFLEAKDMLKTPDDGTKLLEFLEMKDVNPPCLVEDVMNNDALFNDYPKFAYIWWAIKSFCEDLECGFLNMPEDTNLCDIENFLIDFNETFGHPFDINHVQDKIRKAYRCFMQCHPEDSYDSVNSPDTSDTCESSIA